ncbi:hypothetical protein PIB30_057943 [Stylosanthes scabra]|uniref:Uncharacterized protein n=1 Tax=Stylosanthes scabra TaxID=79078 RepID=A0ABU6WI36_9FABA|nr:hypothetical protein [Stylosanthes scabra]
MVAMPNKWYQSRWLIGLVLRSIYEKHQKSSRQGGSSGESLGIVRRCDRQILECGEGAKKEGELNAQCRDSHLRGRLLRCGVFLSCVPSLGSSPKGLPDGFAPHGGPTSDIKSYAWLLLCCCNGTCFKRHEVVIGKFDGRMFFGLWQVQIKDVLIQSGLHKMWKVWHIVRVEQVRQRAPKSLTEPLWLRDMMISSESLRDVSSW